MPDNLFLTPARADTSPLPGSEYIHKLHRYIRSNLARLAPVRHPSSTSSSILQQSYTLLTLGLDPNSAALSPSIKIPLTLGLGSPSTSSPSSPSSPARRIKPVVLRLPPDKLLYLLLRWQSLPQELPHVVNTDVPIDPGVPVAARGARVDARERRGGEGGVESVRSWVGSIRSVSMGSRAETSWFGRKQEVSEETLLLELYSMFTVLPGVLIHPPFIDDRPVAELVEAGGYTQLGGIDVRVPLDVLRNLQSLELEAYDPRALIIPPNQTLRELTVRDVSDGDDWLRSLLLDESGPTSPDSPISKFPRLAHLSLTNVSLLSFPPLPFSSLRSLDLSHNLLDSIPASLAQISTLASLNLSGNVITSVRNAPLALGNIHSLNLSHNRIDCVVGLERVLGLVRLDLRSNCIADEGELGRLAEHPMIAELWVSGNPIQGAEWRTELGAAFGAARGEELGLVLDDRPWTWAEKRKIDSLLVARGQQFRPRTMNAGSVPPPQHSHPSHAHPHAPHARPHPRQPPLAHPKPTSSPAVAAVAATSIPSAPSPASSALPKRRRRRRVVNLDGDEGAGAGEGSDRSGSGSPPPQIGGTVPVRKGKTRRERVSASLFEPK